MLNQRFNNNRSTISLAKAVVMFIDEPFYDDACLKKIFTGATPQHNGVYKYNSSPNFFFIYVVLILIKENNV